MPVSPHSDLQTVSFVLTKEQVRRLRDQAARESTAHRKVSMSDVVRDVVEAGLGVLSYTQRRINDSRIDIAEGEAA